MRIQWVAVLIGCAVLMSGLNVQALDRDMRAIGSDVREQARARAQEATPDMQVAPPASPQAGAVPGGMSGPDSISGSCWASPTPFPGLDCCDTRDCGWFSCGDANVPEKGKAFR